MTVSENLLKLGIDEQSVNTTVAKVTQVDERLDKLASTQSGLAASARQAVTQLKKLEQTGKIDPKEITLAAAKTEELNAQLKVTENELNKAKAALDGLEGEELDRQRAKVSKLDAQYVKLNKQIDDIPDKLQRGIEKQEEFNRKAAEQEARRAKFAQQDQFDDISKQVSLAGDFQSNLGAIQGLAGLAGAGGLATGVGAVGEVAVLAEELPRLKTAIQGMPATIRAATETIGINVTQLGLMGGAVGLLTVAVLASSAAAKKARADFDSMLESQSSYFDLLVDGTSESLAEQEEAARRKLEVARQEQATLQAQYEELQNNSRSLGIVGDVFEHLSYTAADGLFEGAQAYDALRSSLGKANDEVTSLEVELNNIERARQSEQVAANDTAAAEEDLTEKRQASREALDRLIEQENSLVDSYNRNRSQLIQDRKLQDSRELEDWKEQMAEGQDRLAEIRSDGLDNLEALEADAGEALVKAGEKASDARIKQMAASESKITETISRYQADELKREAQFAKDRKRAAEDLRTDLFNAELANDILALTQAKRAGEKEKQRAEEDFRDETKARTDEQDTRLAALREENTLRLSEIKAGLGAEREQITQALAARTLAEKAGIEERIAAEEEAQAKAEASRDKRLARQEEDEQIADDRRREALDLQLAEIDEKRDAELAALGQVKLSAQQIEQVVTAINRAIPSAQQVQRGIQSAGQFAATAGQGATAFGQGVLNQIATTFGFGQTRASQSSGSATNDRLGNIRAFADGGIVPAGKRVIGEFERNRSYDEAVIPLRPRTLAQVGIGGPTVYNSFGDITIGAGNNVTEPQVKAAMLQALRAYNQGTVDARIGVAS